MQRGKGEIPEKNESKRQMAKQRHGFTSINAFVKHYFPNYYQRVYRYKEAREAYLQKLLPPPGAKASRSTT